MGVMPRMEGVMPKETINYPAPDATSQKATELSVHWNTTVGWIQACLTLDRDYVKRTIDDEDATKTSYFTPVLSLEEIDKLIKTLQRARRKSYGDVRTDKDNECVLGDPERFEVDGIWYSRGDEFARANNLPILSRSENHPISFNRKTLKLSGYEIVGDGKDYVLDDIASDFVTEFATFDIHPDHTPDKYGFELKSVRERMHEKALRDVAKK
jgi:hypothetical protein